MFFPGATSVIRGTRGRWERRRINLRAMLRLESCVRPAGESPVRVSVGAPGSRPRFVVERSAG